MSILNIYCLLTSSLYLFIILPQFIFTEDEPAFNSRPLPSAVEYLTNGKYYTKEGDLFFAGNGSTTWTDDLTIFFKRESIRNHFFKMRYCLEDKKKPKCKDGITICYDSQLAKFEKFQDVKLKKMEEIECEKASEMGIHVYTEQSDKNGEAENFVIKASIDKHFYRFNIPESTSPNFSNRCFYLKMGSENSVVTTVTNNDGKKLIYVGDPPIEFKPEDLSNFFDSKNPDTMNLWMLYMDFTPFYLSDEAFMPRPFRIKGSNDCQMTLDFDHESINVCKQNKEYIGGCDTEYLDSSDLNCNIELHASDSTEKEKTKSEERSHSKTDTNTQTQGGSIGTSHTEEEGTEIEREIGVKTSFGAPFVGKLDVSAKLRIASHHTTTDTTTSEMNWENSNSKSETTGSSSTSTFSLREVKGSENTITVQVHRTDGGPVSFFQTVLECGGITYRYHKVTAKGNKDSKMAPQSTVVYEWREGQVEPIKHPINPDVSQGKTSGDDKKYEN